MLTDPRRPPRPVLQGAQRVYDPGCLDRAIRASGHSHPARAHAAQRAEIQVRTGSAGATRRHDHVVVGQLELLGAPGGQRVGGAGLKLRCASRLCRQVPHRPPIVSHFSQRVRRHDHERRSQAGRLPHG